MTIDLTEIADKQFSAAVRGWNREEVKRYLAEIAAAYVPVLEERNRLRREEAANRLTISRLENEVGQLQAEAAGYRAQVSRRDWNETDMLADVGSQVKDLLLAAEGIGMQIRERAERYAATVRHKALDEATAIDQQSLAIQNELAVARQQVVDAADDVRHVEAEVTASARSARRDTLTVIAKLVHECERLRGLAERAGTPGGPAGDPVAGIEANLHALRDKAERPQWPLPGIFDPSTPLLTPDAATDGAGPASRPAGESPAPEVVERAESAAPAVDAPEDTPVEVQNVAVIGAGHVGIVIAAGLARLGHTVVCTNHRAEQIERLSRGDLPFAEPGAGEMIREEAAAGRLSFGVDNGAAAAGADVVMLCLPTPEDSHGHADLSMLESVAREIGPRLAIGAVVADKSTAPVGSARRVAEWLGRSDVPVVVNPEFLREGSALADFFHPDRVIIGADDLRAAQTVASLYRRLGADAQVMTPQSAELVKYASNGMLASRLSYANDIATICELVQADVGDVIGGMGSDHRIGPDFLEPGPGWGGSCLPKDADALIELAAGAGFDFRAAARGGGREPGA